MPAIYKWNHFWRGWELPLGVSFHNNDLYVPFHSVVTNVPVICPVPTIPPAPRGSPATPSLSSLSGTPISTQMSYSMRWCPVGSGSQVGGGVRSYLIEKTSVLVPLFAEGKSEKRGIKIPFPIYALGCLLPKNFTCTFSKK